MNPYFPAGAECPEIEIRTEAEADELWSYIGHKGNQRRTWYAVERSSGVILAWHNGRRTDESCSRLMDRLSVFRITRYYTDDWRSYRKSRTTPIRRGLHSTYKAVLNKTQRALLK